MPECHKCELNGSGDPACITCGGPGEGLSNRGQSVMSFDAMAPDSAEMAMGAARGVGGDDGGCGGNGGGNGVDAPDPAHNAAMRDLGAFIRQLMTLHPVTRDIVCLRYLHLIGERNTFEEIAVRHRITPQAAEQRLSRAIRCCPGLRAVFAAKVAKHERRMR